MFPKCISERLYILAVFGKANHEVTLGVDDEERDLVVVKVSH